MPRTAGPSVQRILVYIVTLRHSAKIGQQHQRFLYLYKLVEHDSTCHNLLRINELSVPVFPYRLGISTFTAALLILSIQVLSYRRQRSWIELFHLTV